MNATKALLEEEKHSVLRATRNAKHVETTLEGKVGSYAYVRICMHMYACMTCF